MKKFLALILFFLTFILKAAAQESIDYAALNQTVKEHLINLININTAQPEPEEIYAARYIYKVLNKNKINWDIYRTEKPRANLIAVLKADKSAAEKNPQEALIVTAHLDTSDVQGSFWTIPPTKAMLKDGRIYGLGSTDAKNYAAVNLTILTWLKQNNIKLNRDIIFLFTADEENGSDKGIKFLYDKYPKKIKAGFAINEGGGIIRNGGKEIMFVEAASKMYMDILLTAYGEGSHSATPGQSNAIYKLSQALSKIEAYKLPLHITPFTVNFLKQIYPLQDEDAKTTISIFLNSKDDDQRRQAARIISEDPFFKTQLTDTISPTIINSGAEANVVAPEAYATLNCRLLPDSVPHNFFAGLASLFENDDGIKLTILEQPQFPFPQPDPYNNNALFRAIENAVWQTISEDTLTVAGLSPASSESEFLRRHNVITYGIGPRMEKDGGGPHQADENISEESLFEQLKLTLAIILNFARIKEEDIAEAQKNQE
ncbi:MAG: M20/M25/M40 family metallo-hydrolase [Elusimicrobiota bacterium]|jgi:acetylornithine deacetylase/succinyl-diaminopimelate desuccinylase-like protein|nr:M20/M25/M40 family metallo-hydrolase [Elusimicrobiota bacterium]